MARYVYNTLADIDFQQINDFSFEVLDTETGQKIDLLATIQRIQASLNKKVDVVQGVAHKNNLLVVNNSGEVVPTAGVVMTQAERNKLTKLDVNLQITPQEREKLRKLTDVLILKGVLDDYASLMAISSKVVGDCYYVTSTDDSGHVRYVQYVWTGDRWSVVGTYENPPEYTAQDCISIINGVLNVLYDNVTIKRNPQNNELYIPTDSQVTPQSGNFVTSGAIYTALQKAINYAGGHITISANGEISTHSLAPQYDNIDNVLPSENIIQWTGPDTDQFHHGYWYEKQENTITIPVDTWFATHDGVASDRWDESDYGTIPDIPRILYRLPTQRKNWYWFETDASWDGDFLMYMEDGEFHLPEGGCKSAMHYGSLYNLYVDEITTPADDFPKLVTHSPYGLRATMVKKRSLIDRPDSGEYVDADGNLYIISDQYNSTGRVCYFKHKGRWTGTMFINFMLQKTTAPVDVPEMSGWRRIDVQPQGIPAELEDKIHDQNTDTQLKDGAVKVTDTEVAINKPLMAGRYGTNDGTKALTIGNGTSATDKSNATTIDLNGNIQTIGDVATPTHSLNNSLQGKVCTFEEMMQHYTAGNGMVYMIIE